MVSFSDVLKLWSKAEALKKANPAVFEKVFTDGAAAFAKLKDIPADGKVEPIEVIDEALLVNVEIGNILTLAKSALTA